MSRIVTRQQLCEHLEDHQIANIMSDRAGVWRTIILPDSLAGSPVRIDRVEGMVEGYVFRYGSDSDVLSKLPIP